MEMKKTSFDVLGNTTNGIRSAVLISMNELSNDALETIEPSVFIDYDISVIVDFLFQSHHDFLKRRLPRLFGTASQLLKNIDDPKLTHIGDILLSQFAHDMETHFKYEEENLFPYALKCAGGNPPLSYSTELFEASHPEFLIDTKKLLKFFRLHENKLRGFLSYRMLINELHSLEDALEVHSNIEDKILIDKLRLIERA
jgi:iron-sulfur cluster repair protein YtfE (RIC family)